MGDYGLKVSKDGYEVTTATDIQTVYSSEFNNFKVSSAGTTTLILTGAAQNSVDVTHSLGYVPAAMAIVIDGSKLRRLPCALTDGTTGFDLYIDSSKIRIYGEDSGGVGGTYTIKYYIFLETIE